MQKREKYDTYFHKGGKKYQKISEIKIQKGIKYILIDMKLTKKRGFGRHNLAIYHKKNRNNKKYEDPWYILTSLHNAEEVIKVYIERNGIETIFKDCKTGGYNARTKSCKYATVD